METYCIVLTPLPHWTKWPPFWQTTISNAFSWMKMIEFQFEFHWFLSQESTWQWVSIGSGNGLAPSRWQAITWTNADLVHWRIYAALSGDELKQLHALFVLSLQRGHSSVIGSAWTISCMFCRVPLGVKVVGHWGRRVTWLHQCEGLQLLPKHSRSPSGTGHHTKC